MYQLVDKKSQTEYCILDTDDGVVDTLSYDVIIDCLERGIEIDGCIKIDTGYLFTLDNSEYHKVMKGYKFRLYPTALQRDYFSQCFGCCRLIWNKMLADKIAYYNEYGETEINKSQWLQIVSKAKEIGGEIQEAISEADVWAKKVFETESVFTILGI